MSIVKDLLPIITYLILFLTLAIKYYLAKQKLKKQRDYFIKTLNHDLRVSTLAQIRALDLLKNSSKNIDDNVDLISDISDSCKYTFDMITTLLKTYQFENGEQILNYEVFSLRNLIQNCILDNRKNIQDKGVNISYEFQCKNETVDADKSSLKKVLNTLMSTALLYSNKSGNINCSVKKINKDFVIKISYTGTSLSEEEYNRMFNNNTIFSTVGQGIKMHFCKKIIEFHGGKIKVVQQLNKTNSFVFTLPVFKDNPSAGIQYQ